MPKYRGVAETIRLLVRSSTDMRRSIRVAPSEGVSKTVNSGRVPVTWLSAPAAPKVHAQEEVVFAK